MPTCVVRCLYQRYIIPRSPAMAYLTSQTCAAFSPMPPCLTWLWTQVPASKKSKKKKKGGSSTRTRGRRPAAEMFWDTADQEEPTYNGPPVIVTYNVSE